MINSANQTTLVFSKTLDILGEPLPTEILIAQDTKLDKLCPGKKQFAKTSDVNLFIKKLEMDNSLYEYLRVNTPIKLFIDAEIEKNEINDVNNTVKFNDIKIDKLIALIIQEVNNLTTIKITINDIVVLNASTDKKLSYHLIVANKVYFENMEMQKRFIVNVINIIKTNELYKEYNWKKDNEERVIIDSSVYCKKSLRCVNQNKFLKTNTLILTSNHKISDTIITLFNTDKLEKIQYNAFDETAKPIEKRKHVRVENKGINNIPTQKKISQFEYKNFQLNTTSLFKESKISYAELMNSTIPDYEKYVKLICIQDDFFCWLQVAKLLKKITPIDKQLNSELLFNAFSKLNKARYKPEDDLRYKTLKLATDDNDAMLKFKILKKIAKMCEPDYFEYCNQNRPIIQTLFTQNLTNIHSIIEHTRYIGHTAIENNLIQPNYAANKPLNNNTSNNNNTLQNNTLQNNNITNTTTHILNNNLFPTQDIFIMDAMMCSGKTVALIKMVEKALLENPNIKILACSPRCDYSDFFYSEFKRLGFVLYNDCNFETANLIICQMESLYKLSNLICYDWIIMDESESNLKQFTSTTMNKRGLVIKTMDRLFVNATKIILCDAFVTNKTLDFARALSKQFNKSIGMLKNTTNLHERLCYEVSCEELLELMFNCILIGETFCSCFSSKDRMMEFRDIVRQKAKDNIFSKDIESRMLFYYAHMDSVLESKTLENVNESWSQYDYVIYTPKITVGISYNVKERFDKVFFYAGVSACGRDCMQMLNRVRNSKVLYYALPTHRASKLQLKTLMSVNDMLDENKRRGTVILTEVTDLIMDSTNDTPEDKITQIKKLLEDFDLNKTEPTKWDVLFHNNVIEDLISQCYYNDVIRRYLTRCNYKQTKYVKTIANSIIQLPITTTNLITPLPTTNLATQLQITANLATPSQNTTDLATTLPTTNPMTQLPTTNLATIDLITPLLVATNLTTPLPIDFTKVSENNNIYVEQYNKIILLSREKLQLLKDKINGRKAKESDYDTIEKYYFKNIIKDGLHINIESSLFYLYYMKKRGKTILYNLFNEVNFVINYEKNTIENYTRLMLEPDIVNSSETKKIKERIAINNILGFKSSTDIVTEAKIENIQIFRDLFEKKYSYYYDIFGHSHKNIQDANNEAIAMINLDDNKSKFNSHVFYYLRGFIYSKCGMGIQSNRNEKKAGTPLISYTLTGENLINYLKVISKLNDKKIEPNGLDEF